MKIHTNQKGFSIIELILIVAIIGILGGVGWYVYSQQNKIEDADEKTYGTTQTTPESIQEEKQIPDGYKEYTNSELNISFYYPAEWGEVVSDTENNFGDNTNPIYKFTNKEGVILGGLPKSDDIGARGGSLIDYGGFKTQPDGTFTLLRSDGQELTSEFYTNIAKQYVKSSSGDCIYSTEQDYYGENVRHAVCNVNNGTTLGFNIGITDISLVSADVFKTVVESVTAGGL